MDSMTDTPGGPTDKSLVVLEVLEGPGVRNQMGREGQAPRGASYHNSLGCPRVQPDTRDIPKVCSQVDMVHPVGKEGMGCMDILEDMGIPGSIQDKGLEGIQRGSSFLDSMKDMGGWGILGDRAYLDSKVGMESAGRSEDTVLLDNIQDMVSEDILGGIYSLGSRLGMVQVGIQRDN